MYYNNTNFGWVIYGFRWVSRRCRYMLLISVILLTETHLSVDYPAQTEPERCKIQRWNDVFTVVGYE